MLVYATPEDLTEGNWMTEAPANAAARLRSASGLVAEATAKARYATDDTGMPTDMLVREAFRDATCAQVTTWTALGIDPALDGADAATTVGRIVTSKNLGPASLQYAGVDAAQTHRTYLATHLTTEATSILALAGLLGSLIGVRG